MTEPSTTAGSYVFLSYASAEQDRAIALGDALQQAGIPIWLDRHAIAGGSAWSTAIVRGIKHCAAFLVLGSERAFRSPNVQRELNLAVEENRPVLPLLLEQVTAPDDVRYALAGQQWVSLLDRTTEVWLPEVLRALAGLGIVAATPVALAVAPPSISLALNLPTSLTSFLGREQELIDLAQLLATNRLVTLIGSGGAGKTRVALAVGSAVAPTFVDGLTFVPLAAIRDPTLVVFAIADAIGVKETPEQPLLAGLQRALQHRKQLLILDNFEQVSEAAPTVAALLEFCPGVHVLVTSRALLHVRGEQEFALQPLGLPAEQTTELASIAATPAVRLFVERAATVRPGFQLTAENAGLIAAICRRLDGLPLALELAAARAKVLPLPALLARLDQRLSLLTGGARDLPARQQTLRDAIAWSYDLLEPAEQELFRHLAVFVSGWTFAAAEAVCSGSLDALDGISSLVDNSLVVQQDGGDGEPRFSMLATIREFGWEQLARIGELRDVQERHATYFLSLAEEAEPYLMSARRDGSLRQLDVEADNVRAALGWAHETRATEKGLRLVSAIHMWFFLRSHAEGRQRMEAFLSLPGAHTLQTPRAGALTGLAMMAFGQSNYEEVRRFAEESAGVWLQLGDTLRGGYALTLAAAGTHPSYEDAHRLAEEGIAHLRRAGEAWYLGNGLMFGGFSAVVWNHMDIAHTYLTESKTIFESLGDRYMIATQTQLDARVIQSMGDDEQAVMQFRQALGLYRDAGDAGRCGYMLSALAEFAVQRGAFEYAAALLSAAVRLWEDTGIPVPPQVSRSYPSSVAACRAALGDTAFDTVWSTARRLRLEEAVAFALQETTG